MKRRACRVCGCTDDFACVNVWGESCAWVARDLCDACLFHKTPPLPPASRPLRITNAVPWFQWSVSNFEYPADACNACALEKVASKTASQRLSCAMGHYALIAQEEMVQAHARKRSQKRGA
jgi:hypothetical protein